jgi:hypothetical protein
MCRQDGCLGLSVGKPHKTGPKAFHFRGLVTGAQILQETLSMG